MANRTNKEGDGTISRTIFEKHCKVCSKTVMIEVVDCSKCQAAYHPSCAKTKSVLSSGRYHQCCGPKKTLSYDMRELMDALRKNIRGDINKSAVILQNTFTKTTEALFKRLIAVENDTSNLKMTVVDLKNKVTVQALNDEVKLLASGPVMQAVKILMEVENILSRHNIVIIFDVEESNSPVQSVRDVEDLEKIKNICSSLNVPATDCKCFVLVNTSQT